MDGAGGQSGLHFQTYSFCLERGGHPGNELCRKCYVIPRAFVGLDNNIKSNGHLLVTNLSLADFLYFTHQVLPRPTVPNESTNQATPVLC